MKSSINISITGTKETNEVLKNISNELTDFTSPLIKSGGYYLEEIDTNFENSGNTFGKGWEPLHKSTIREKEDLFKKGRAIAIEKPLIRTGWLRNSFFYKLLNRNNIEIESKAYYANLMHKGGISNRGGMVPARTLVKIDEQRITKVTDIFSDWIKNIVNKYTK